MLRKLILAALLTTPFASASMLNVIFFDNRYGTLNDSTGVFTQLSTLPLSASAGVAYDNGTLYVENMGSDLYSVDPVTGASQLIGPTGLATTAGAFAGALDGLFEVDYSSNLYSINPLTGQGTLIGATGLPVNNGSYDTSLSDDGTSLLYTAGRPGQPDELYRINLTTGVATDLGSTGVTAIAGSAFVNGDLELFQYGQSTNYIYSAADGSSNFVRSTSLGTQIVDGGALPGLSPQNLPSEGLGAPEPASAFLLLCGAGLIFCIRFLPSKRAIGFRPLRD